MTSRRPFAPAIKINDQLIRLGKNERKDDVLKLVEYCELKLKDCTPAQREGIINLASHSDAFSAVMKAKGLI